MTELTADKMVVKYDDLSAAIAKMTKDYMKLTIGGVKDTRGYEAVHAARMDVKSKRVGIQHQEQAFKDVLNTKKKEIVGQAQEIYKELKPIESYLDKVEGVYTTEKERIAEEKKRVEKERVDAIQFKISLIRNVAQHLSSSPSHEIKELHKSMKNTEIAKSVYQEFEAEAEKARSETLMTLATAYNNRKAQEQADEERRAEDARLAEERKAQEATAKALTEREAEFAKKEAAAKAEKVEPTTEAEKEALEASKSVPSPVFSGGGLIPQDKDVLESFANYVSGLTSPTVQSTEANAALTCFRAMLDNAVFNFRSDIENL